jgi:undecaprenyl-diphosphatase
VLTSLGNGGTLIPLALIITVLFWKRKDYILYGSMLIITLESSHLLVTFLKEVFKRDRPDILRLVTENSYSFPSSHALISICFYGFLIYLTYKLIKGNIKYVIYSLLILLILLIGISRIYLGVHYASDVIAGYSAGFIWLMACIYMTKQAVIMNKKG